MTEIINEEFIIAVCFIAFAFFAYRPIKKAIFNALDQKIIEIKNNLKQTEKIKEEAKYTLENLDGELKAFEQSKRKLLADAKKNIEAAMKLKNDEMKLLFARIENSAIQNLEYKTDQATENMKKQFIEKTMNVVQAYLKETNNNSLSQEEIIRLFTKK